MAILYVPVLMWPPLLTVAVYTYYMAVLAVRQAEDQKTLAFEMALTGRTGECYSATPRFGALGPAFLVYYGPALLRQAATGELPTVGLRCLAEVYRAARELWPLSSGDASKCVTLRVDRLKAVETAKIVQMYEAGQVWLLKRASDKEGVIELMSLHELSNMIFGKAGSLQRQVLKLWELKDQETLDAAEAAQLLSEQQGGKSILKPPNLSRAATRRLSNAMLGIAKVAPCGVETPSRRRSA